MKKKQFRKKPDHAPADRELDKLIGKPWWENQGGWTSAKASAKNKPYSGAFRGGHR